MFNFDFTFNPMDFITSLPIMGKGMLGIFLVIMVIYVTILLLTKIFKNK